MNLANHHAMWNSRKVIPANLSLSRLLLTLSHVLCFRLSASPILLSGRSFKGAAFGFHMIAAKAGEQLAPFLPQLVPRLYRYQFDPNLSIRQAMTSIWDALVTDKTLVVDWWLLI